MISIIFTRKNLLVGISAKVTEILRLNGSPMTPFSGRSMQQTLVENIEEISDSYLRYASRLGLGPLEQVPTSFIFPVETPPQLREETIAAFQKVAPYDMYRVVHTDDIVSTYLYGLKQSKTLLESPCLVLEAVDGYLGIVYYLDPFQHNRYPYIIFSEDGNLRGNNRILQILEEKLSAQHRSLIDIRNARISMAASSQRPLPVMPPSKNGIKQIGNALLKEKELGNNTKQILMELMDHLSLDALGVKNIILIGSVFSSKAMKSYFNTELNVGGYLHLGGTRDNLADFRIMAKGVDLRMSDPVLQLKEVWEHGTQSQNSHSEVNGVKDAAIETPPISNNQDIAEEKELTEAIQAPIQEELVEDKVAESESSLINDKLRELEEVFQKQRAALEAEKELLEKERAAQLAAIEADRLRLQERELQRQREWEAAKARLEEEVQRKQKVEAEAAQALEEAAIEKQRLTEEARLLKVKAEAEEARKREELLKRKLEEEEKSRQLSAEKEALKRAAFEKEQREKEDRLKKEALEAKKRQIIEEEKQKAAAEQAKKEKEEQLRQEAEKRLSAEKVQKEKEEALRLQQVAEKQRRLKEEIARKQSLSKEQIVNQDQIEEEALSSYAAKVFGNTTRAEPLEALFEVESIDPSAEFSPRKAIDKKTKKRKVIRFFPADGMTNHEWVDNFHHLYEKESNYYQDISKIHISSEGHYFYRNFYPGITLKNYLKKTGLDKKTSLERLNSRDLEFLVQIVLLGKEMTVSHSQINENNILVNTGSRWSLKKTSPQITLIRFTSQNASNEEMTNQIHQMLDRLLAPGVYVDFRNTLKL